MCHDVSNWPIFWENSYLSEVIPYLECIATQFSFSIPIYSYTGTHGTKEQISLQTFSKPVCESCFLLNAEMFSAAIYISK